MKPQPAEFTNASEHDLDSESRLSAKRTAVFPRRSAQLTTTRTEAQVNIPQQSRGALGTGPLKAAGLDPKLQYVATYETFSLKIPIQPAVQLFLRQLENRYRFT